MKKQLTLILLTALLLGSCSDQQPTQPNAKPVMEPTPIQADEAVEEVVIPPYEGSAELGKLYAKQACGECHGSNGIKGKLGSPFIAGQSKQYLINTLQGYINGDRVRSPMKQNLGTLDETQLIDIASYYASLEQNWQGAGHNIPPAITSISFSSVDINAGAENAKRCNACHGKNGNSSARLAAPSLAAMPPNYFIYSLKSYFDNSRQHKFMKLFGRGSLDDKEIEQMAAYYAVQKPTQSPKPKIGNPKQGAKIVGMDCGGCHGLDGNASNPDYPNLAGQPEGYLISAMKDYRDGRRNDPVMPMAMRNYTDNMINDIAAYYSSQKPLQRYQLQTTNEYPDLRMARRIAKSCDACHGVDGNSTEPGIPSLTGMSVRYISYATTAYRDGGWDHGPMQVMTSYLSNQQIEELGLHYASLTPTSHKKVHNIDYASGEQIANACALCHSDDASRLDPRLPSLSGQDMQYIIAATKAYSNGQRQHDEMSAITTALLAQDPANLKNIAGYYANKPAHQPPQRQPQQPVITAVKQCNNCHGEKGRSINPKIPRLNGQSEGYLIKVMGRYLNFDRPHEGMNIIARQLTMMEIKGLAAYYAGQ